MQYPEVSLTIKPIRKRRNSNYVDDKAPDSWDSLTGFEIKNGAFVYPEVSHAPSLRNQYGS